MAAVLRMISGVGGEIEGFEDGFVIRGGARDFRDFRLETFGDHRIAMAGIVMALVCGVRAEVLDCESIATSFPNFFEVLHFLGVSLDSAD